jgi:FKBP-type peptidyl-prolyl cis-trans isomerase
MNTASDCIFQITKTWRPTTCPRAAKRKDFVTFHYKAFTEDGRKYDQSYGRGDPIRMQLGVGMTMPGLDKGMRGMCNTELRKLSIPYRLSRKKKSKGIRRIVRLFYIDNYFSLEKYSKQLK